MAHHSWPRIPGKGIGYTCICLAISPFLVGFSAEDSTGWSVGAGVSRSRTQYVTGCTPKYYSMRQTEIDARIEYVHAKTPERAWSPAIQVQAAAGGIRTQRTLLAEVLEGSINDHIDDTLYVYPESERITWASSGPILKMKVGFAWKYAALSVGVLGGYNPLPIGEWLGGDPKASYGPNRWSLFPCGGIQIIPWGGYYGFYNMGDWGPTVLGAPYFTMGLGHQGKGHDISFGLGGGFDPGTKALLVAEKHWGKMSWILSGSVFLDLGEKQVGPLRPGDWSDLGLAIRVPFSL
jgi:hypothetical protein